MVTIIYTININVMGQKVHKHNRLHGLGLDIYKISEFFTKVWNNITVKSGNDKLSILTLASHPLRNLCKNLYDVRINLNMITI